MQWTPEQDAALRAVADWLRRGDRPVFRLFGYAGTGKTTLAKHFASGVDGRVVFGAFTGKAAYVLQQKGCPEATTIHKMIYKPKEKSRLRLRELQDEKAEVERVLMLEDPTLTAEQIAANKKVVELQQDIDVEIRNLKKPSWSLNTEDSLLTGAALVVIDECSMVDGRMADDLMHFQVPILVLGDPGQLPPVKGEGFFTSGHPDVLLTQIQRQAKDNPIIRMATDVREGRGLKHGTYGDSKVIAREQIDRADLMASDQVLVGKNKSRKNYNARMRELKGLEGPLPVKGDKLVCLRNNHELALLNGSMWMVEQSVSIDRESVDLDIRSVEGGNSTVVTAHSAYFRGEEPPFYEIKDRECFDYGGALTVHKSQGSQWNYVYLFDESHCFRQDARKHLYTALTRAAEKVTVVL